MRARGIAGRHERREPGREDEDPLVAIDDGYLKLDGTEDDDDDDEMTHNKLLILVVKDVKTGKYAATCLRERRSESVRHVVVGVFVASAWVSQSDIAKRS